MTSTPRWKIGAIHFAKELAFAYGALWLATEITTFFSESVKVWLVPRWWIFLATGAVWATAWTIRQMWPKRCFSCQLAGRDVTIEIRIKDAFDIDGSLIVPCNTTFDTDLSGNISRANSVQGRVLRDFYLRRLDHLDQDLKKSLEGIPHERAPDSKPGKKNIYQVGTVALLEQKERTFYFLALSTINMHGRAQTTKMELDQALAKMWYDISERGPRGDIVVPLLGVGHGRLDTNRAEVVKATIRSFIASCSQKTYCNRMIISVYPPDLKKHKMDLEELAEFLDYCCKYVDFNDNTGVPVGHAEG